LHDQVRFSTVKITCPRCQTKLKIDAQPAEKPIRDFDLD
jgi:hypothetical protein